MKILRVFLMLLVFFAHDALASDMCETHDFGWDRQTDIDFKGWSWDFEAENDMIVTSILTSSRIAAWDGTLTIQVKINSEVVAEWDHYIQDTYYSSYIDYKGVNVELRKGDTITYFIYNSSGGPGATRGDNYIQLCGDEIQPEVAVNRLDFNVSGTPQPGGSLTFTASASNSEDGDVYYLFNLIPNYGTDDYDAFNNYETLQSFSTTNILSHRFSEAGSYILVVFASPTPSLQSGAPIIGGSITIGGDQKIHFKSLKTNFSDNPRVGDQIKLTAEAINTDGSSVYYRFDLIPGYGTDAYDPYNNWETIRDFSTTNSVTHTFSQAGSYIVVVRASSKKEITEGAAPMFGCSITVE